MTCIRQHNRIASFLALLLLTASFAALPLHAFAAAPTEDEEIKLGKEAAAEVEKQSKFIKDEALVKRVETIGAAIAKVAKAQEVPATYGNPKIGKFDYQFKIVDDKEVNAFALPAGYVYVNKGLLDYIHSDDELAGILAHEISHAAHHHLMALLKAQEKENTLLALAMIAGAAVGAKGENLGQIWQALTLIRIAKISAYSQDAEFDADKTAVALLAETKYNPVGVLTSMEKLARDEIRKPQVDMGLFATHPTSNSRARAILTELEKRKIPVNRRLVTNYVAVQTKPVPDSKAHSIWIGDTEIIRLVDADGEKAEVRAERTAARLTAELVKGAKMYDVRVDASGRVVTMLGNAVIAPAEADAGLFGKSVPELAAAAANAIKRALLNERLNQQY